MTLNPSRNTLTLAQHTPRMLILSTSRAHNTPWQQHQNLQNIQNELHLFTEQSEINTDVILFHSLLRKPKAWCEFLILPVDQNARALPRQRCLPLDRLCTTLASVLHTSIHLKNLQKTEWRRCDRSRSDAQVSDGTTKTLREKTKNSRNRAKTLSAYSSILKRKEVF